MADPGLGAGSDALEETLGRLSKKPGVKATIVLDRASGAILKTSGQVGSIRKPKSLGSSLPAPTTGSFSESAVSTSGQDQSTEELAALVWNFVGTASSLVQELDTEDELKLLRLRTKKQELVIVPDSKYLLIVVHDTPLA
ncbi:hypothetical protein B0H63DRAFT_516305 [Podospora didyma]|uniref:Roadblock/LAMTOR2 domain-containing protein n=1 Tax=Podospora didyma TaxID=330526 RepID=A0AAE0U7B3_9PEZI|nr:hypothetical protein B0H63DRAFT_516305 [Podospora didyma]